MGRRKPLRRYLLAYDAVNMQDWQIAEAAEVNMPGPDEWRDKLSDFEGRDFPKS